MNTMLLKTIEGICGKGYRIAAQDDNPRKQTTLDSWFLLMPGGHPFWHCYFLGLVHLRDVSGLPPAHKAVPFVEHELVMYALDAALNPDYRDMHTFSPLRPLNYVVQFGDLTDEQATELCGKIAEMFVQGQLIAEPQGISGAYEMMLIAMQRAGALVVDMRE